MKFGKTLARRQLDIPEYAASFVNYKALKKLIKSLGAGVRSPSVVTAPNSRIPATATSPQATLQESRAPFFFRLERELDKVNTFYLQKEAELQLRLKTLIDKKRVIQSRSETASKVSATYVTLREGFQQFEHDLSKLQQFVEINAIAFSKILKKWDKSSKSRTKELYISRAVEIQPCFNRDVITELSDQALNSLMEIEAWAEGENISFSQGPMENATSVGIGSDETDSEILRAVLVNNTTVLKEWINRLQGAERATERITRTFLAAIPEGTDDSLKVLMGSNLIDLHAEDEINERNCLHEAAIAGRPLVLDFCLRGGCDVSRRDFYGRLSLHYAAMHGRVDMARDLVRYNHSTIDATDHDNFTPLLHAIIHNQKDCAEFLITSGARINPRDEQDHIPLNVACQYGFEEISELLLQHQAHILPDAEGLYPQHLVARSGRSVQHLLLLQKYGANVNELDKLFQWTPIFHAAAEGHADCLKALLNSGGRADILDEKGLSAMYYAAWEGHLECMHLLSNAGGGLGVVSRVPQRPSPASITSTQSGTQMTVDSDGIPDLSLPPPILPLRRYGHNFLENKTLVQLSFEEVGGEAILFDHDSKHPAARLTISSKTSDLIPRNLLFPLNEDSKSVSFQIHSLESFAVDFDIYPTFGSKVIARTIALADTFRSSSGSHCILPLFDPRLRCLGRLSFDFQIIRPFLGQSLEITHFATYWKATSQLDSHSNTLITGSSLAGEYARLHVQLSSDNIALLYPHESIQFAGLEIPICSLTFAQFQRLGSQLGYSQMPGSFETQSLAESYTALSISFMSLRDALLLLPPTIHIDLKIIYPSSTKYSRNARPDLNAYVDTILETVFEHARALKQTSPDLTRAIVFSSTDTFVCTALNWKQPNYPVFYCSDLDNETVGQEVEGGKQVSSMKEAVRFASENNLMGLICSSSILTMVPALVESVKVAGLVLVAHTSHQPQADPVPTGIDGILQEDGILIFKETIDM